MRFLKSIMLVLSMILVCGCFFEPEIIAISSESEGIPLKNSSKEADPIESVLQKMPLEEKIGQMMTIGVYGKELDKDSRFMLNAYHFGGVIFYDRNMDSQEQVKRFSDEIQSMASDYGKKIPLFIALDEEGGRVSRMSHALPPPPSQEEIGMSGDYFWAEDSATDTAKKLRSIGVNLNFAPVADVGGNDTRSFSADPAVVAEFVSYAAKGYEKENFFYCLKHFPGIGRGKIDTHQDISEVDAGKEILMAEDLLPFKKIIDEHDNSKFMIMVGHLKYTDLDPNNAASLSKAIITDILRQEFNFKGVIITDDLNMGAVSNYSDIETVSVQAIKAGVDIILICHEYELQKRAFEAVLAAVNRGEISEDRINQSVRRILKMKLNL